MYLIDEQHPAPASPCVTTIGFFDGVHRGHQYLIRQVQAEAQRRGVDACIVTFAEHPRRTLAADFQPRLLTTLDEKLDLLADAGVDRCCVLRFDREMASLHARDFMKQYLKDRLHAEALIAGYDHRFGAGREEGFAHYVHYGQQLGIDVKRARPLEAAGVVVSSSATRRFLEAGNVEMAALCLGRPYDLSGTVAHGHEVGRTLGFPTANVVPGTADKIIPAAGVYAARCTTNGQCYDAMVNVGTRPTFDGDGSLTIEAHLFNFDADLYGQPLRVDFIARLREERRFDSPDDLRRQLEADARDTRTRLRPCGE